MIRGEVLSPMKATKTMIEDLSLLNVGERHLASNVWLKDCQTKNCCKFLTISKLDSLVQKTIFFQSSMVQCWCLCEKLSCLFSWSSSINSFLEVTLEKKPISWVHCWLVWVETSFKMESQILEAFNLQECLMVCLSFQRSQLVIFWGLLGCFADQTVPCCQGHWIEAEMEGTKVMERDHAGCLINGVNKNSSPHLWKWNLCKDPLKCLKFSNAA